MLTERSGSPARWCSGQVCRDSEFLEATYINLKSKYGGMEAADSPNSKELTNEKAQLNSIYSRLALENSALKDVIANELYVWRTSGRWFSCQIPFI